jgi:OOP family OmpA-OmpF porin
LPDLSRLGSVIEMSGDKPVRRYGESFALILGCCGFALGCGASIEARAEPAASAQSELIPQGDIVVQNEGVGQSQPVTYSVRIHKEFDRIKLKGSMASDEDYKTLIGLVKASFPSAIVTDRVKVTKIAANRDVKIGGLSFALKLLGYVEKGKASVDDNGISLEGSASTAVVLNDVKKTLADDRPTGVPIRIIRIAPPVKSWTASLSKDGTLKISGVMPDESGKKAITAAAGQRFPERYISDGTSINARLPDKWMKAALHALDLLSLLDNGSVEITDQSIRLKGDAPSETAVKLIDARSTEIPSGFALNSEVTSPGRPGVAAISSDEALH